MYSTVWTINEYLISAASETTRGSKQKHKHCYGNGSFEILVLLKDEKTPCKVL